MRSILLPIPASATIRSRSLAVGGTHHLVVALRSSYVYHLFPFIRASSHAKAPYGHTNHPPNGALPTTGSLPTPTTTQFQRTAHQKPWHQKACPRGWLGWEAPGVSPWGSLLQQAGAEGSACAVSSYQAMRSHAVGRNCKKCKNHEPGATSLQLVSRYEGVCTTSTTHTHTSQL
jgi:hypothetical protein